MTTTVTNPSGATAEAVGICSMVLSEEMRRAVIGSTMDVERKAKYCQDVISLILSPNHWQILKKENLDKVWSIMRKDNVLTNTVFSTASRLRGLYSADEWAELLSRLSSSNGIFTQNTKGSVIDPDTAQRIPSNADVVMLLESNQWIIPLMLLSYMPTADLNRVITLPRTEG